MNSDNSRKVRGYCVWVVPRHDEPANRPVVVFNLDHIALLGHSHCAPYSSREGKHAGNLCLHRLRINSAFVYYTPSLRRLSLSATIAGLHRLSRPTRIISRLVEMKRLPAVGLICGCWGGRIDFSMIPAAAASAASGPSRCPVPGEYSHGAQKLAQIAGAGDAADRRDRRHTRPALSRSRRPRSCSRARARFRSRASARFGSSSGTPGDGGLVLSGIVGTSTFILMTRSRTSR